jgi:hypothetical protein
MFLSHESHISPEERQFIQSRTGPLFLREARSMILLIKHLDIESHGPGWYVSVVFCW